ncbi:MAG: UbiD family decarboxylase [Deltaproteobacteria bacterium]|nr:UbiD family decarboxylase [Deltaproteobacteria bacterium]
MPYESFREYVGVLESRGLIRWIDVEVDKDWEITSVARTYFRRTPESERCALGFRRVKGYDIPVILGVIGGSRRIYSTAIETEPTFEKIKAAWQEALSDPIPPVTVETGPCKEVILKGEDVDLNRFPVPVWTPGKDPGPFFTAPCLITRDPETGIGNIGTYRMEIKGRDRTGVLWDLPSQHGAVHYAKYERMNRPMPMAVAIGVDPTIIMASVTKVPLDMDEMAVAGGLRRKPVEVVGCETVDLRVPASAEIVLEGEVLPGERVSEGPFGEYTGYMGGPYQMPRFHVKCITHRRDPLYHALFSQMPPSESSLMRQLPEEANIYQHLAGYLKIPGIRDVHLPETGGSYAICWISMENSYPGHAQQVLCASWTHYPAFAKWIVVTDEDIDIRDPFAREWALSFRVEPARDIFFIPNTSSVLLDPSAAPPEVPLWERRSSKICIDATRKWKYPEVALPPQKYLDRVSRDWTRYGLE